MYQGSEREVGHLVMGAILGLRIVVPEALRRPFGRLLRQRQYGSSSRFGVPVASCRGSGNPAALRRHCGADKLNHRSRL